MSYRTPKMPAAAGGLLAALLAVLLPAAPARAEEAACKSHLYEQETLGALRLRQPVEQVLKALGKPATQSSPVRGEATGDWVYMLEWPARHLRVGVAADQKRGPYRVAWISLQAGGELRTGRGIGIGSTLAEVTKAYPKDLWDPESLSAEEVTIGSDCGGMILFRLEKGAVKVLFIGPVPE